MIIDVSIRTGVGFDYAAGHSVDSAEQDKREKKQLIHLLFDRERVIPSARVKKARITHLTPIFGMLYWAHHKGTSVPGTITVLTLYPSQLVVVSMRTRIQVTPQKPLERTKYTATVQYILYKSANVCGRSIQQKTQERRELVLCNVRPICLCGSLSQWQDCREENRTVFVT